MKKIDLVDSQHLEDWNVNFPNLTVLCLQDMRSRSVSAILHLVRKQLRHLTMEEMKLEINNMTIDLPNLQEFHLKDVKGKSTITSLLQVIGPNLKQLKLINLHLEGRRIYPRFDELEELAVEGNTNVSLNTLLKLPGTSLKRLIIKNNHLVNESKPCWKQGK